MAGGDPVLDLGRDHIRHHEGFSRSRHHGRIMTGHSRDGVNVAILVDMHGEGFRIGIETKRIPESYRTIVTSSQTVLGIVCENTKKKYRVLEIAGQVEHLGWVIIVT